MFAQVPFFGRGGSARTPAEATPSSEAPVEDAPPLVTPEGPAPRVVVIGAGRMGQLIAGHLAVRGAVSVVLHDRSDFTRDRALAAVRASLQEHETDGLLVPGTTRETLDRISVSASLEAALEADLVIEAVPEELELKRAIFTSVDQLIAERCKPGEGPLLCSNSISLAPADIFAKIKHRKWCNMRFLSPVYFVDEVELIGDDANSRTARAVLKALGMSSIPKMTGEKLLDKERVNKYYDRQRELVAKGPQKKAASARTPASETPKDLPDCCVCLTRTSGALILPCGHTNTCHDCALMLVTLRNRGEHRCPICRGYIEKVLQADCPTKAEHYVVDGGTANSTAPTWTPNFNFLTR